MYYVYVLYSEKLKTLHKGSTSDLKQRIRVHNSGGEASTKFGKPWILLYYEAFTSKKDALIEEKYLKSGKGRERLKYILKHALTPGNESAQG